MNERLRLIDKMFGELIELDRTIPLTDKVSKKEILNINFSLINLKNRFR